MGLRFTIRSADIDESPLPGEAPEDTVLRLAKAKAAAQAHPGELVLAADTVVVLAEAGGGRQLLGKPAGPEEAEAMLARLAGREHVVFTGVALLAAAEGDGQPPRRAAAVEESRVRLARLGKNEIAWYVATGEPLDKAGAYAIQGIGALFVEAVEGNYTNVVGLPLPAVYKLFAELGHDLRTFLTEPQR
jgi:septum formation protein